MITEPTDEVLGTHRVRCGGRFVGFEPSHSRHGHQAWKGLNFGCRGLPAIAALEVDSKIRVVVFLRRESRADVPGWRPRALF